MKINKEVALQKAKAYLENKYPELTTNDQWINFDNIYWAKTGTKSKATRHGFADKYGLNKGLGMRIGMLPRRLKEWYSYDRKTPSGWICPIGGVDVEPQVGLEIILVHELTHIIQYILGLTVGELLTTINEQEYIFDNYPRYAKYLVPFKTRQLQEKFFKRNARDRAMFQKINGEWTFIDPDNPPQLEGRITSIPPIGWEDTHKRIQIGSDIYYQEINKA
jgi:hypothetical protein